MSKKPEIILSCPFCGCNVVNVNRTNEEACWVECTRDDCGAQTASEKTRAKAIAIWNRRVEYAGLPRMAIVEWDMDKEFKAAARKARKS